MLEEMRISPFNHPVCDTLLWPPDTKLLQVINTLAFWYVSLSSEFGEESITQLLEELD